MHAHTIDYGINLNYQKAIVWDNVKVKVMSIGAAIQIEVQLE